MSFKILISRNKLLTVSSVSELKNMLLFFVVFYYFNMCVYIISVTLAKVDITDDMYVYFHLFCSFKHFISVQ